MGETHVSRGQGHAQFLRGWGPASPNFSDPLLMAVRSDLQRAVIKHVDLMCDGVVC